LIGLIQEQAPRAVLFGHSSIGMDIASGISAKLNLPMVSSCRSFSDDGKYVSQICGGKIMAEGTLPGPTVLVTMVPGSYKVEQGQSAQAPAITNIPAPALDELRVTLKQYIEPDKSDVDITKEPILVAVGRGIQNKDNIDLANDLANAMGGVVCASRPVVDQGWMPTTRLVGKIWQTGQAENLSGAGHQRCPRTYRGHGRK